MLRLFLDRPGQVREEARGLTDHRDAEVRRLARRIVGADTVTGPAEATHTPKGGESLIETRTGLRFLGVPGGSLVVGDDEKVPEKWRLPRRRVTVAPFWLAETPVTNARYALFLKARGTVEEPPWWRDKRFSDPSQPVVGVDWHEAAAFCEWLGEEDGRLYRLPSEIEWEFAARGPKSRAFPWGDQEPGPTRAHYGQDWDKGGPAAVGSCPAGAGPFGHLDLAGNVWEWCDDDVSEEFREEWDSSKYVPDDLKGQPLRALRGGGWAADAEHLRSAGRDGRAAVRRSWYIGFRVFLSPASTGT